jgi:hypothetical protein
MFKWRSISKTVLLSFICVFFPFKIIVITNLLNNKMRKNAETGDK